MKTLIDKFIAVEKNIAEAKADFVLFALFLREESLDRWDLVISARWFGEDEKKTLDYIVSKIKEKLTAEDLIAISRIVLLNPNDPFVKNVNSAVRSEHGGIEVVDCQFNNISIKHAFIITSKSS